MTQEQPHQHARDTVNRIYGTYADVIFVLFPFVVVGLKRAWEGNAQAILMSPDLSVAAAILGGLALGKFVLGLITDRNLSAFRERIVFFIALTLLLVLGPSILLLLLITSAPQVPGMVAFIQPILLIVSISLYTTAVSVSNLLTRPDPAVFPEAGVEGQTEGSADDRGPAVERTLDLPHRNTDPED